MKMIVLDKKFQVIDLIKFNTKKVRNIVEVTHSLHDFNQIFPFEQKIFRYPEMDDTRRSSR